MKHSLSTLVVVASLALLAGCGGGPVGMGQAAAPSKPDRATQSAPVPEIGTKSGLLRELRQSKTAPPTALRIASLGISSPVMAVGVDADDRFDVPSARDVGWYEYGPAPGEAGSAVLAAHVAYDGVRGAFADLAGVKRGAEVIVEFREGADQAFRVVDVTSVAKADLAGLGVFERAGRPLLTLVTCGGEFDPQARSYKENIVVTAEAVA